MSETRPHPHHPSSASIPQFRIGDLVWCTEGVNKKTLKWPAMVTYDPKMAVYFKTPHRQGAGSATPLYHVQYFGVQAMRGWVTVGSMEAIKEVGSRESLVEGVAKCKRQEYQVALEETEQALLMTHKERKLAFIFNYDPPGTKRPRKSSRRSGLSHKKKKKKKPSDLCRSPSQGDGFNLSSPLLTEDTPSDHTPSCEQNGKGSVLSCAMPTPEGPMPPCGSGDCVADKKTGGVARTPHSGSHKKAGGVARASRSGSHKKKVRSATHHASICGEPPTTPVHPELSTALPGPVPSSKGERSSSSISPLPNDGSNKCTPLFPHRKSTRIGIKRQHQETSSGPEGDVDATGVCPREVDSERGDAHKVSRGSPQANEGDDASNGAVGKGSGLVEHGSSQSQEKDGAEQWKGDCPPVGGAGTPRRLAAPSNGVVTASCSSVQVTTPSSSAGRRRAIAKGRGHLSGSPPPLDSAGEQGVVVVGGAKEGPGCRPKCSFKDGVCAICDEEGIGLLLCEGCCGSTFHLDCMGLINPPAFSFVCDECQCSSSQCFLCKKAGGGGRKLIRCSRQGCTRVYHFACIQGSKFFVLGKKPDTFTCPLHFCARCKSVGHTSASNVAMAGSAGLGTREGEDLLQCTQCPLALHGGRCLVAGCEVLGPSQMLCYRHVRAEGDVGRGGGGGGTPYSHVNIGTCLECGEPGSLYCCDFCSAAYHGGCLEEESLPSSSSPKGERWYCPNCVLHDLPVYGSMVICKHGRQRWEYEGG